MTTDDFEKVTLPDNHYLQIAKSLKSNYLDEFIIAANNLKKVLAANSYELFWNEKMQLNKSEFNEKAFIQGACEVAVANHFYDRQEFKIEAKVNPSNNKNVDCQFKSNGFTYNIEVKCASFDSKEIVQNNDSFKFQTFGRVADRNKIFDEISKALDEGLTIQGKPLRAHEELKNMDNNLKDFLESAHEKFNPTCPETEVNILLIGCDDPADMQSWLNYLFANEGLLTDNSFSDSSKYNNVDLVILTNLYFKHKSFERKQLRNSWSLEETLNFVFYNPLRARMKEMAVTNFFTHEIKNYTLDLQKFNVAGSAPEDVKNAVRVPHFVIDHLERKEKIHLFEIAKS